MQIFRSPLVSSSFRLCIVILFLFASQLVCKPVSSSLSSKRIVSEWKDINRAGIALSVPFNTTGSEDCGIRLSPMKNNLLEWHFSFTGMDGTAFDGGIYHGKILLHPDYPRKAPVICVTTPSGRWEINVPICLSGNPQSASDLYWNLFSPPVHSIRPPPRAMESKLESTNVGAVVTGIHDDSTRRNREYSVSYTCS